MLQRTKILCLQLSTEWRPNFIYGKCSPNQNPQSNHLRGSPNSGKWILPSWREKFVNTTHHQPHGNWDRRKNPLRTPALEFYQWMTTLQPRPATTVYSKTHGSFVFLVLLICKTQYWNNFFCRPWLMHFKPKFIELSLDDIHEQIIARAEFDFDLMDICIRRIKEMDDVVWLTQWLSLAPSNGIWLHGADETHYSNCSLLLSYITCHSYAITVSKMNHVRWHYFSGWPSCWAEAYTFSVSSPAIHRGPPQIWHSQL